MARRDIDYMIEIFLMFRRREGKHRVYTTKRSYLEHFRDYLEEIRLSIHEIKTISRDDMLSYVERVRLLHVLDKICYSDHLLTVFCFINYMEYIGILKPQAWEFLTGWYE